MFPGENEGEYEPIKIRRKEKPANGATTNGTNGEEPEWEEDRISEEGAIWPIQNGTIVDWQCFYALLEHVHNTVNPPFHTPILLIGEPVWTHKEYEKVAQFIFEKFKTPAFFPVVKFHNRMHLSPRPTLSISFCEGWTAKSLMPAGISPGPAVSPDGRDCGLGMGALMDESTVQSRVRLMAMVLSSAALNSLDFVMNCRPVTARSW